MSGIRIDALAGVAPITIQASVLWATNGWNATHVVMYVIAAVLLTGAVGAGMAARDD
ncbi:MAG: hypothetical protein O3B04_09365 [Chloroflexi bacterium]|nr:hypothetical protein [Chloroflexota bacterium]